MSSKPLHQQHKHTPTPIINGPIYYQSPIDLQTDNISFKIDQDISFKGRNKDAILEEDKTYNPQPDHPVFLTVDDRKYQLQEYHFHTQKSEHAINGIKKDAELHYVFTEMINGEECKKDCNHHICDGHFDKNTNYLVIARLIRFKCGNGCIMNLNNLQLELPDTYFECDGTLTANNTDIPNNYAPVRFIVGDRSIKICKKNFNESNSKTSRALQELNNRIILHN
jgi:carbonic anhydrase